MRLLCIALTALLAVAQAPPSAQNPSPSPGPPASMAPAGSSDVATPTDPRARLELARKMNGLRGFAIQPWHLKAGYEVFNSEGTSSSKGTFEEWWASDKLYKTTYQADGLSSTGYRTDHGFYHAGDTTKVRAPLAWLEPALINPLAALPDSAKAELWNNERNFGKVKLTCTLAGSHHQPEDLPQVCLASSNAVLEYASTGGQTLQTLFQHIQLFRDRYVAHDILIYLLGRPALTIHVDTLEALVTSDPTLFAIPADAVQIPDRQGLPGVITQASLISKVVPQYPASAKMQGVQGRVVLDATIGTNGEINFLQVLAGPKALQQPALDAVRQWTYKPYLLNGEPIEVETDINVIFSLR